MGTIVLDLRYAFRQLLRAPGFAAVAVTTLALGIGANTALFSLANTALLRAMPGVGEPDGLVWVHGVDAQSGRPTRVSRAVYEAFRDDTGAFAEIALMLDQPLAVSGDGEPEQVAAQIVSGNYFSLLRASPALGRLLTIQDDRDPSTAAVAVIGYDLWQRRFGADPAAIGRTIFVNRVPHTVVGVAGERFIGAERNTPRQIWVPMAALPGLMPAGAVGRDRHLAAFRVVARLKPGIPSAQADGEVAAVAARMAPPGQRSGPLPAGRAGARTSPASSGLPPVGLAPVVPVTTVSLGVTGLILLIACSNVSNLLLARGVDRRREFGIRLAIGAARQRVVRQLLVESLVTALAASGLGVLFALWTLDLVVAVVPDFPIHPELDARVLAFSLVVGAAVAVLTGLAPALVVTRASLTAALKSAGGDPARSRLQSAFVVAQVAMSLVLLVLAGLFLRSLDKAARIDMGYDTSRRAIAATVDVGLHPGVEGRRRAAEGIVSRVAALPGVTSASLTTAMPAAERVRVDVEALDAQAAGGVLAVDATEFSVLPGFFRTIGLSLLRGRDFTDSDGPDGPHVAMVNEAFAARAWPERGDPVGMRLRLTEGPDARYTVIAVIRNSAIAGLDDHAIPAVYFAYRQRAAISRATVIARVDGDATRLGPALRAAIAEVDPHLPISRLQTLDRFRDDAVEDRRAGAGLLALFGGLGLLLAGVGIAGTMATAVSQRTREIGIRLALGAAPSQVIGHFVGRGLRLVAVGVVAGLALAAVAARAVAAMLFGVGAGDLPAYAIVAGLLVAVAVVACWIPARRAAQVDPLRVLAGE